MVRRAIGVTFSESVRCVDWYRRRVSPATYKDLCLDACDPLVVGEFWSKALGLELDRNDDGEVFLAGPSTGHTVWINRVAEPKTSKNRIHLDVFGSSVEELQALGASVIDPGSFRWVVMADPEGGEFCLFTRETPPEYRLYEVVVDCADHEAISRWWESVIGGLRSADDRGFSYIEQIPNAPFDNMSFVPVAEPKSTKNRIHFDVVAQDVESLTAAGALVLRRRDDEISWDVLADPEGNEFCVFSQS